MYINLYTDIYDKYIAALQYPLVPLYKVQVICFSYVLMLLFNTFWCIIQVAHLHPYITLCSHPGTFTWLLNYFILSFYDSCHMSKKQNKWKWWMVGGVGSQQGQAEAFFVLNKVSFHISLSILKPSMCAVLNHDATKHISPHIITESWINSLTAERIW